MKYRNTLTTLFTAASALTLSFSPAFSAAVSPEELNESWSFYGEGSRNAQNRMFYMEEGADSKGVMVVSPESYQGDITVRYDLMPMNAASVCVVVLAASDTGSADSLTMPENYDGSMGHWINNIDNYFFAFHNAAHDRTPFGIRFPDKESIGEYSENVLRNGEFYTIEVSRKGNTLSFAINGETLFEGTDPDPLEFGHIALRIRGIPQQAASCLIKNLVVENGSE